MPKPWANPMPDGPDLHLDLAGRPGRRGWPGSGRGPAWKPACGRRCRAAGCARTPGCRPRGRWPPTSASPATPWPRPSPSWWPRAGSRPGSAPAPGSATRTSRGPGRRPADPSRAGRAPRLRPADRHAGPLALPAREPGRRLCAGPSSRAPNEALGNGDPRGRIELRTALAVYLSRARGVRVDPRPGRGLHRVHPRPRACWRTWSPPARPRGHGGRAVRPSRLPRRHRHAPAWPCGTSRSTTQGARVDELGDEGGGRADAGPPVPARHGARRIAAHPRGRLGAGLAAAWSSRTTTTASSVTTERLWARCRRSTPSMSSTPGRPASRWLPACGCPGWCCPKPGWTTWSSAKLLADRFTGVFDQLALADLIDSGGFDRQVRRARLVYRRRRDRLVAALARRAPDGPAVRSGRRAARRARPAAPAGRVRRRRPGGGAWRCRGRALGVRTGEPDGRQSALVVGYATPPEHAFTTALARLCARTLETRGHGPKSTPGFSWPWGSSAALIARMAASSAGERDRCSHGVLARPTPCSALMLPPSDVT